MTAIHPKNAIWRKTPEEISSGSVGFPIPFALWQVLASSDGLTDTVQSGKGFGFSGKQVGG